MMNIRERLVYICESFLDRLSAITEECRDDLAIRRVFVIMVIAFSITVCMSGCSTNREQTEGDSPAVATSTEVADSDSDAQIELYAGPGTDYVAMGTIDLSSIDRIVKVEDDWAEVERNDMRGYVSASSLEKRELDKAPRTVTKVSQNVYPYPTIVCVSQQISLFDEAVVYYSPKGSRKIAELDAGSNATILTAEDNGSFRYIQIEFDTQKGRRRGYSTVTDLLSLDNPLRNFDKVKASNMPILYSGLEYWSTSGDLSSVLPGWSTIEEFNLSHADIDVWSGFVSVIASNDINDEAYKSTEGKVWLYSNRDRQYVNANSQDSKASNMLNLIDTLLSGISNFAAGAVKNTVLNVSLEEYKSERRIVIEYGVPFETNLAGKITSLSALIAKNGSALDVVESDKREDETIKKMYPNLDKSKTYSMRMTFSKDFSENGYGYYLVIDKDGTVRANPIVHSGTSFLVYCEGKPIFDAAIDLSSAMIEVDEKSSQTVLRMLADAGFEVPTQFDETAISGEVTDRDGPNIVNADSDASEKMEEFERRRAEIEESFQSDPRLGGNMVDMQQAFTDYANNLTTLMHDTYSYLETQPSVDKDSLRTSQDAWASGLQSELDMLTENYKQQRYSNYKIDYPGIMASRTRERLDDLFDMIRALSNS